VERHHLYRPEVSGRIRRDPSAAGAPILAEENIEDTIIVDGALVRPGNHFALRIRGTR
jgi:SOS-response transcriptional repressor LexA